MRAWLHARDLSVEVDDELTQLWGDGNIGQKE